MRNVQRSLLTSVVSTSAICACALAFAEEPSKPSLDDQLLQDLAETPPTPPVKKIPTEDPADLALRQDLIDGEDLGVEKENPLQKLVERMKQSQSRISGRDISDETQKLQREISDQLTQLIEQAQKQSKSGGGEGKAKSGKAGSKGGEEGGNPSSVPASESTQRVDRADSVERGSADVKDTIRRVWGHLPEKMREQMQNSLDEQFLPKYEKLIEDYYRRLAEERGPGT
jgi:hypothetical protein